MGNGSGLHKKREQHEQREASKLIVPFLVNVVGGSFLENWINGGWDVKK